MPIKPYEFTKSADIIAKSQAQIQQMRMSNDPNLQKMAHNQQFLDSIFKLPEIRKAQKLEDIISNAMSLEQREDESPLDFQIRQQKQIRENAASLDPNVAVQANQRLMLLQTEKEERRLFMEDRASDKQRQEQKDQRELARWVRTQQEWANEDADALAAAKRAKTREERERIEWEHAERVRQREEKREEALSHSLAVITNTKTGQERYLPVEGINDPSLSPGERSVLLENYIKDNPGLLGEDELHRLGTGADVLETPDVTIQDSSRLGVNNSTLADWKKDAKSKLDYMRSAAGYLAEFEDNLFVGLGQEQMQNLGSELGAWQQVALTLGLSFSDAEAANINSMLTTSDLFETVKQQTGDAGVARGKVMELAYKLARVLDPGGRLSDQDVDMALKMLTGTGDTKEIIRLMEARYLGAVEDFDLLRANFEQYAPEDSHFRLLEERWSGYADRHANIIANLKEQYIQGRFQLSADSQYNSRHRDSVPKGATVIRVGPRGGE